MGERDRAAADIVEYWRAVEYFLPQDLPKLQRPSRNRSCANADLSPDGEPLPWEAEHRFQHTWRPDPKWEWRHTVYCGVLDMDRVRALLTRTLGADAFSGDVDERPLKPTALCAFQVDSAGRPLLDTEGIGSSGWAAGRTLSPGPQSVGWLSGFDGIADLFALYFEWLATGGPNARTAMLRVLEGGVGDSGAADAIWERLEAEADRVARGVVRTTVDPTGASAVMAGAEVATGLLTELAGEEIGGLAKEFLSGGDDEGNPPDDTDADSHPGGTQRRAFTKSDLQACLHLALKATGLDGAVGQEALAQPVVRVKSKQVKAFDSRREQARQQETLHQRAASRGRCDPPENDPPPPEAAEILNSFVASDLGRVAAALRQGDCGPALRSYLTPPDAAARIQRTDVAAGHDGARVAPERLPAARWPAPSDHPLVYSQQVAVNEITARLGGDGQGLFSVNGPPGTGKTTLLRDLVANVVTERARVMARLERPADGFGPTTGWRTGRSSVQVRPPIPELCGHEVVVASANNGAVENVTKELPSVDAIGDEWAADADYFSTVGTKVLGAPAWGAFAAQLGKREKRREFAQRFWEGGWSPTGERRMAGGGMDDVLSAARSSPERWRTAVTAFRTAEAEVNRLVRSRRSWIEAERRLSELRAHADRAPHRARQAAEDAERAGDAADSARIACSRAEQRSAAAERRLALHASTRPRGLGALFPWARVNRAWHATAAELGAALDAAAAETGSAAASARDAELLAKSRRAEADQAAEEARTSQRAFSSARDEAEQGREEWRGHLPLREVLADDSTRERAAFWGDAELVAARTRVFLAAMEVHRAFIEGASSTMHANLRAVDQLLRQSPPGEAPEEAVLGAWQSLFLVVPVVSTTFASFARQFERFGREDIGWLLIDEAGQATPQLAAGALWRSRRAVVVGDPLQLEPICPLPFTAQQQLRAHFDVADNWVPGTTSIQELADRVTPLGTYLQGGDGNPLWVGSPLRVHRRCDDPMFSISNETAYGGLMVHGTAQREEMALLPSMWTHITPGDKAIDHWVVAEGEALHRLLGMLHKELRSPDQIFVISPFKSAANQARKVAERYGVPGDNCGTIHVAQGKEADVVVLILGGNPRRPGARAWAAQRPNLVNVAASRAKRRLYVIGDHAAWSRHNHFSVLARHLGTPWDFSADPRGAGAAS